MQNVDVKSAIAGKVAGVQINGQTGSKLGQTGKKLRLTQRGWYAFRRRSYICIRWRYC